jgi:hypothetical protein
MTISLKNTLFCYKKSMKNLVQTATRSAAMLNDSCFDMKEFSGISNYAEPSRGV